MIVAAYLRSTNSILIINVYLVFIQKVKSKYADIARGPRTYVVLG